MSKHLENSEVRKFDSRPCYFAAENQSHFTTYFEQENQFYELEVRKITAIGAHFRILRLAGEPQGPQEDSVALQMHSNQLHL